MSFPGASGSAVRARAAAESSSIVVLGRQATTIDSIIIRHLRRSNLFLSAVLQVAEAAEGSGGLHSVLLPGNNPDSVLGLFVALGKGGRGRMSGTQACPGTPFAVGLRLAASSNCSAREGMWSSISLRMSPRLGPRAWSRRRKIPQAIGWIIVVGRVATAQSSCTTLSTGRCSIILCSHFTETPSRSHLCGSISTARAAESSGACGRLGHASGGHCTTHGTVAWFHASPSHIDLNTRVYYCRRWKWCSRQLARSMAIVKSVAGVRSADSMRGTSPATWHLRGPRVGQRAARRPSSEAACALCSASQGSMAVGLAGAQKARANGPLQHAQKEKCCLRLASMSDRHLQSQLLIIVLYSTY